MGSDPGYVLAQDLSPSRIRTATLIEKGFILKTKLILLLLGTVLGMAGQSFSEVSLSGHDAPSATPGSDVLANVLAVPSATPRGPQDLAQDYEARMASVTQQYSAKLAAIAAAVHRGELTAEQGRRISAEQYHLAQMQFDLLSALREKSQQDLARRSRRN
jgi:hypothetical protein